MQPGPAAEPTVCPACGAPVPSDSRFCGHCGHLLATEANYLAAAPTRQSMPPGLSMPPAAPPGVPVPVQSAPAGQPPAAFPAGAVPPPGFSQPGAPPLPPPDQPGQKPRFLSRPSERVALLALVVVIIGGGVVSYFLVQNTVLRHGLPGDIPLPDHASFVQDGEGGTGSTEEQDWTFTVAGTTAAQADSFYQSQLPKNGWQITSNALSANGTALIAAQKNGNAQEDLQILATSNHPGSTTLAISLVT